MPKLNEKIDYWEKCFWAAKSTGGRHWAMTQLNRYVGPKHPIVQMYRERYRDKPESRNGWWALEPEPKNKRA